MDIGSRLIQLGIEVTELDREAMLFAEEKTREHILNVCNTVCVPKELEYLATDMACAEFIKDRYMAGLLADFDARGALKAITEGDVRLEYNTENGSDFDSLMEVLNRGEADLYRFRKLRW